MNDLMELVEQCETFEHSNEKAAGAMKKAQELAHLGFKAVANEILRKASLEEKLNKLSQYKYVAITPEKIKVFLKNKADAYNKEHNGDGSNLAIQQSSWRDYGSVLYFSVPGTTVSEQIFTNTFFGTGSGALREEQVEIFEALTCHSSSTEKGTIGKYRWTETPVEQYKTLPPENVLNTFKTHKSRKVFDYFTIASVEGIHDPLLLGRLKGDNRCYFIAQWGDDIKLDDVI